MFFYIYDKQYGNLMSEVTSKKKINPLWLV